MPRLAAAGLGLLLLLGCLSGAPGAPRTVAAAAGPGSPAAATAAWLEAHREEPAALRAFLQRMPKGGDIHSHLSGAVYAESYLAWAQEDGFCLDAASRDLAPPPCDPGAGKPLLADAVAGGAAYSSLIDHMSIRNLESSGRPGRDQFFSTFGAFRAITASRRPDMVAEVASRAAAQNVTYLELMLTLQRGAARELGAAAGLDGGFEAARGRLFDRGLAEVVAAGRREVRQLVEDVRAILGCGTPAADPGCAVTVRFQQSALRFWPPELVFGQLAFAFELARAEPLVVGVNLVAPEDDRVALDDYRLHMEMVGYLSSRLPEVDVSLHAGELALGLVPPRYLRSHVREAVEIAGARRIGHGAALGYERDPAGLMARMRERGVLVEICLTSNEVILGVAGDAHPFVDYWRAGVPLALATDDEGVSRIDLTHEFQRAASTYGLGYRDLKRLARNSLSYSFLPGDSLWRDPVAPAAVAACAGEVPGAEASPECREFLDGSERAREQWRLEGEFRLFEGRFLR